MVIRRIVLAGAAVGLASVGVLALAGTAGASEPTGVITHSTTSYSSPSNQTAPVRSLAQGTPVDALCFTQGQDLNGNHYWFRIAEEQGTSFVHRDAISVNPNLPKC